MTPLGILLVGFGYAFIYTGIMNWSNGFTGPRLSEALGFPPGIQVGLPSAPTGNTGARRTTVGSKTRSGSDVTR